VENFLADFTENNLIFLKIWKNQIHLGLIIAQQDFFKMGITNQGYQ